jgi:xanthine dehydrogenase accessory factor
VLANADALTTTDAPQRSTRTNADAIATTDARTNADAIATTDAPILDYFLMHIQPAPQLILIGGNHIAVALARLAHVMGYRLVVIDPRSIFATPERFPQVEKVYAAWPQEILPQLHLTEQTAFVLLTHDPKIDDIALEFALRSRSGYIGALGSRRTHAKRLERLAERGISSEQLQRIFGPIGLAIGAETPEQIALSILSEIVLHQKRPPMAPRLPVPPSLKDQPAPRT